MRISLVASSIRPHLWQQMYQSLAGNTVEWEVIMVGPFSGPTPPNFTYIPATVKPAQCYEIGFRKATGDLLSWTADDATYSPQALDLISNFWNQLNNEKIVIAFRTIEDGRDITEWHRFRGRDPDAPRMAPFGVMNRKLFNELGGYDKRFVCGQSENDVVMRAYELGGHVEICNDAQVLVHHQQAHNDTVFRQGFYFEDRKALEGSWVRDGIIQMKRLDAVQRFEDTDITTITQGPKGKWI